MNLIIDGEIFKQFRDTIYFLNKNGEIYSSYAKRKIKGCVRNIKGKKYRYVDVWNKQINKQQHINIHKMVYIAWNGEVPNNLQVNHKNDNELDNRLENLYVGNQKQNIYDCIKNNHRVGSVYYLTVYDKVKKVERTFCPAKEFIDYCGHKVKNGAINRMFSRNWFKTRYDIISYGKISNLQELFFIKSVTTNPDECRGVE